MRNSTAFERSGRIFFVSCVFIGASYLIYFLLTKNKSDNQTETAPADPFLYEKADPLFVSHLKNKFIIPLSKESLEESVDRLDDIDSYVTGSGTFSEGGATVLTFPMEEKVGKFDIRRILSNRRFLKAYWGIAQMSKSDASALLSQQISATLPIYIKAYKNNIAFVKASHPDPKNDPVMLGAYQISSNKDGTPTLLGLKYKLFSLLLIAGNLKLPELRPAVIDIAKTAIDQYREASDSSSFNIGVGVNIVKSSSLYNRQILLTSLNGILKDDISLKSFFNDLKNQPVSVKLTKYDSLATEYDTYAMAGLVPIDYSGGSIMLQYYEYASDSDVRKLVE